MAINWSLLNEPNAFERNFEQGRAAAELMRQRRQQEAAQNALASFAMKPNEASFNALAQAAPQYAMQARQQMQDAQFRSALGDYASAGMPATGGRSSVNALAPSQPVTAPTGQPMQGSPDPATGADPSTPAPFGPPDQEGDKFDLSFLGEPQSGRDRAFARMMQIDPLRAMQIESDFRERTVERLRAEREIYGFAVEALGRVNDEAGWQEAMSRFLPMVQEFGGDLSQIPANYPGPEAVREIMAEALPIKEQLDNFMQQANIDADNARADRNTNSLISNRDARLEETRRSNRTREGISASREERISSNQGRGGSRRGSRSTGGGSGGNIPTIASPRAASNLAPGTQFRTPDGRVFRVPQR
ncbi:hypothetical protein [Alteraurantiacibacter buctensis]|uniref:Uncharacterized protein n=1 Tax=Alteraurantiacibacter buctensis TaxID=1503981 RepID=A0A844YZ73_9SPHN|nr:hypothetical protein [Alteraurantiacibacter buctensis]MXO72368.1 hypothetical protein [Alteraurantiacibacter buctensis]